MRVTFYAGAVFFAGWGLATSDVQAQETLAFNIPSTQHAAGFRTTSQDAQGLSVEVSVRRTEVNGNKSEICARLENKSWPDWSGGYRVTNRNDRTTFASATISARNFNYRCEILDVAPTYYVVLRRDR